MKYLKYFLIQNRLNTNGGIKYIPRTVLNGSLSCKSLVELICWGSSITPSDCLALMEIRGSRQFFAEEDLNQGVFFSQVSQEGITKTRVNEYFKVANGVIGFKIPEGLNPGESYNVEVRALFGTNLRIGKLDDSILIE